MDDHRHISKKGLDLIKSFEGLYLKAYRCPANVWTIGYGHTGLTHKDGTVRAGRVITEEKAEELLAHDMQNFEKAVLRLLKTEVNDDMFAALVSFAFNCGEGNLKSSTLLKRVNSGDWDDVPDQFLRWNKARNTKGDLVPLNGLTRRRASEARLWEGNPSAYIASVDEMKELGYPVV